MAGMYNVLNPLTPDLARSSWPVSIPSNSTPNSKEAVSAQIAAYTRISLSPRLKNSDNMILPSIYSNTSREDAFKLGLQAGIATFEDDTENKSDVFRVTAYNGSFANANPLGLTRLLFTPSLKLLGTDEQIEKWGELAERGEIIGCYSQTE
jgi:hypothetical protein